LASDRRRAGGRRFRSHPEWLRRLDESPDALFYAEPRFVTHIDDAAIAAVAQLYREHFPPGAPCST
jgi:hypothetical protein